MITLGISWLLLLHLVSVLLYTEILIGITDFFSLTESFYWDGCKILCLIFIMAMSFFHFYNVVLNIYIISITHLVSTK